MLAPGYARSQWCRRSDHCCWVLWSFDSYNVLQVNYSSRMLMHHAQIKLSVGGINGNTWLYVEFANMRIARVNEEIGRNL